VLTAMGLEVPAEMTGRSLARDGLGSAT
jgi:hypothetical protein